MNALQRPQPEHRAAYKIFRKIATRWADNDAYGHVNNVVYYSWFDTAINGWLIERNAIDIHKGPVIGFVVETHCNYFAPMAFPGDVVAGIRIAHVGATSVRYEIGIFPADPDLLCAAKGHFVHVYVDRTTSKPCLLPKTLTSVLETL